jgi:hypothetical protein
VRLLQGWSGNGTGRRGGLAVLVGLAMLLLGSGCNSFDGFDTAVNRRSEQERVNEADHALDRGDFGMARALFDSLAHEGSLREEIAQGQGEARIGQAGFAVLPVLNVLQNGTGPYDRAPILFSTVRLVHDRPLLEEGYRFLSTVAAPERPALITRGLARVMAATHLLRTKYDTNGNRRLDPFDEITLDTNDKTTPAWPVLFRDMVTGPSALGGTLESAFFDLTTGLSGRGEPWTFQSPISGRRVAGTFSASNRLTILALVDLIERLQDANRFYNVDATGFTNAIASLDGIE